MNLQETQFNPIIIVIVIITIIMIIFGAKFIHFRKVHDAFDTGNSYPTPEM